MILTEEAKEVEDDKEKVQGVEGKRQGSDPIANADGEEQTLRVTPAMEAGISDHVWEIGEIVELLEAREKVSN